jgi:hypothetical protein
MGIVAMVGPMIFSIPATGALRSDNVVPKITSSIPMIRLTSKAYAALTTVDMVASRSPRAGAKEKAFCRVELSLII